MARGQQIRRMRGGWRLGDLGGVEIRVDPSLLIIAGIVALTLATQIFPRAVADHSPLAAWLAGGIASALLVASVLWHEMAHVLMAQRYHVPVARVVLNIFGGQAQITREPERPEHEFWIALAGPLSSLFLAVFFQVAAWLPGIAGVACGWLSAVNMTLAIFNLLPGFPLDGGRVLRALLWWRWGSYRRATTAASRAGQWVAGGIMLFGFAIFVQGGVISAVLIAMTGFYLYTLSLLSYRTVGGGMPLTKPADLSVQRVMRSHIPIIDPDMRLAIFAWRYLDHAHDQAFPVMVGDALQGMITLAQIEHLPRLEWGKHRVGEYMIPREQLILVGVEDDLETTLKALDTGKVNHAPVYAGEQFVGMLNRRDIIYRT